MIAPAIKATSPDPSRHALLWVQYSFPRPRKLSILATALPLWTERNGEPFCPKSVVPTTFLPQSVHHPVIASHEVAWQSPGGWLLYPSKIYVIATLRPGNTFVLPGRSVLDSQTVWLFSRQGGLSLSPPHSSRRRIPALPAFFPRTAPREAGQCPPRR